MREGATPPPAPARRHGGALQAPPLGSGAKPQKLFKFRIIKLQKDKNFSYFFIRTKSKHEQRMQTAHAHTHFYFENLNEKQKVVEKSGNVYN